MRVPRNDVSYYYSFLSARAGSPSKELKREKERERQWWMARNGDPTMSLHSAAAAVVSQQPHPDQALWYSQQMAPPPPGGHHGSGGERDKGERAVLLVVIVSVASFVRRIFMLVLGLLRLTYRKASHTS